MATLALWRSGRRCRPPRSAAQLRGHGTGVLGLALHAPEATGAAYLAASLCPPASGGWGLAPASVDPKKAPIRESYELRSDYVLDRNTPSTHVLEKPLKRTRKVAEFEIRGDTWLAARTRLENARRGRRCHNCCRGRRDCFLGEFSRLRRPSQAATNRDHHPTAHASRSLTHGLRHGSVTT